MNLEFLFIDYLNNKYPDRVFSKDKEDYYVEIENIKIKMPKEDILREKKEFIKFRNFSYLCSLCNEKGFTLVEVIVAFVLSLIILSELFSFYRSTLNVTRKLESTNTIQSSSRLLNSILYKELYNVGCRAYISDNGTLEKDNLQPIRYVKGKLYDSLIIYKVRLNTKGVKESIDSVKIFVDPTDKLFSINKNNKIIKYNLKIEKLNFEFLFLKEDTIDLSANNKWLAKGQINKELDEFKFNNNSKGEIYYTDYFNIPETSLVTIQLTTVFKKNFPEGLDTFVCIITNDNKDTLAKECFKPTGTEQNIEMLCLPFSKAKIFFTCKAHKGSLKITSVKLIRKNKLNWISDNTLARYAKAIKVNMTIYDKGTLSDVFEIINIPNNTL